MAELDGDAVDELTRRGESLSTHEFVSIIERHHRDDGPGVARELLEAYADRLASAGYGRMASDFLDRIADIRTDSETWTDDALYDVGSGRTSAFPARWHDRLFGETDLREYVEFALADESGYREATGRDRPADGMPRPLLLEAAAVLGGLSDDAAKEQLDERKRAGDLAVYPDQNPNADVNLPENAGEYQDESVRE